MLWASWGAKRYLQCIAYSQSGTIEGPWIQEPKPFIDNNTGHGMGFSETTDFVHFKNIGHFNEGVMKTTNFKSPKHGAVTYLTKAELKAVADHWKIAIDLK